MTIKHLFALTIVTWLLAVSGAVRADSTSIGTYAGCKKLKGSAKASCNKCLKSGDGFFNKEPTTGKWVCGMTSDMTTTAEKDKGDKLPAALKSMPEQQKHYAKIPAGTFRIGTPPSDGRRPSELDADITITRPFMMKTTEVTFAEWYFVMKKMPTRYKAGCMDCPANNVTWEETIAYLNALSKLEKLDACYVIGSSQVEWKGLDCTGYRLPTEAEWEYAARGGSSKPTYGAMDDIAWHGDNSDSKSHPVGGKLANAYGLHDMVGNLTEWTWDLWQEDAFDHAQKDPIIGGLVMADKYQKRSRRGTDFMQGAADTSVAYRNQGYDAGGRAGTTGFRPVRTVKK